MPAVKVFGRPVAKGSMRCVGRRGGRAHVLLPPNPGELAEWEGAIAAGGRAITSGAPLTGPLLAELLFTVPRPTTVKRDWPYTRSSGDTDKLLRAAFDGLTAGGVWNDDAQVVGVLAWKAYHDSPGFAGLERPGVMIRVDELGRTRGGLPGLWAEP